MLGPAAVAVVRGYLEERGIRVPRQAHPPNLLGTSRRGGQRLHSRLELPSSRQALTTQAAGVRGDFSKPAALREREQLFGVA